MWRRIFFFLVAEFAPVAAFFITFHLSDFFTATKILLGITLFECLLAIARSKEPPALPMAMTAVVVIFATLTLVLQNSQILMFQVTVSHMALGFAILTALRFGKNPIRHSLQKLFALDDVAWQKIGRQWGIFLVASGILNELVRTELTEAQWVAFRLTMAIFMVVFAASQVRIAKRHRLPGTNGWGLRTD